MFPLEHSETYKRVILDKEKRYIDDTDNSLFVVKADYDGVYVHEAEGDCKAYVYYTEIPDLIRVLQEVYNEYNK